MATPPNWASAFPKLNLDPNDPLSPATTDYNCIAYAAGDTENWWDNLRYWPPNVPRDWLIEGLRRAFQTRGYEPCDDGALESGYEKVVFYTEPSGKPTHGARQLSDGRWTSKCGRQEDIVHSTPECLGSGAYGDPVAFMKRKIEP